MDYVSSIGAPSTSSDAQLAASLNDVDMDEFLKLMITELQNQDPLDPMETSEMMSQLSQMREISSTDKLTDTLDAVLMGQNLTTASSMIGKHISALTNDGIDIEGQVDRVSVEPSSDGSRRSIRLHVGDSVVELQNIREVDSSVQQTGSE
jgi:flagellar basal-body rod modification protein FlgD